MAAVERAEAVENPDPVPWWTLRPQPAYHEPNGLRPGAARNTGVLSWLGATSSFRW